MKYYKGFEVTEIDAEETPGRREYMSVKTCLRSGKDRADSIEDAEIRKIDKPKR